jgi:hypothetical protein
MPRLVHERNPDDVNNLLLALTAVLVVMTGIVTRFGWQTVQESRKATAAARETVKESNRAAEAARETVAAGPRAADCNQRHCVVVGQVSGCGRADGCCGE